MRTGNTQTLVRRNITMPEELAETMAAIRKKTGIQSDSELIRKAVILFDRIYAYEDEGDRLKAHKANGEVERIVLL
jgi:metal-responsive CopG/Arc/MetJ family transcriptional regulator